MKYKNPNTGEFDTLYVKALDSMPVGTQVEYNGQYIPAGWQEVEDKLNPSIINYFTPSNATSYANYGGCYYYKDGHTVHLHIGVHCSTNTLLQIYTLPEEFRPFTKGITVIGQGSSWNNISTCNVDTDGIIRLYSANDYAVVNVSWDIFEGGNT